MHQLNNKILNRLIQSSLTEDSYKNDITSKLLIKPHHYSKAHIIIKEEAVLCGINIAKSTFQKVDSSIKFQSKISDGQSIKKNTKIATISGKTRSLLTAERTALNFISFLSGISTKTKEYADKVVKYKVKIFDTRKTTPGLRQLEKYAVRCGGGINHRKDLSELILIKDNHRHVYENINTLVNFIKTLRNKSNCPIEVEVDTIHQLKKTLLASPDIILLDNMSLALLKKSVQLRNQLNKKILLEASGGITLKNLINIAKTGIDRISIGALTHNIKSINISMELLS